MRDPYSLLGVQRSANADEIKAAWRNKAKTIHPDHNQDDPDAGNRFAEVGQAYEVLKDPEKRKRYDRASDMQQTYQQQRQAAREEAERARAARARAEAVMEELERAKAEAQAKAAQAAQAAPSAKQAKTEKKQEQASAKTRKADKTAAAGAGAAAGEAPEDMIERIFGVSPDGRGAEASADRTGEKAGERAGDRASAGAAGKAEAAGQQDAGSAQGATDEVRPTLPLMAVDLLTSFVRRIRGTAPTPEKAPDIGAEANVTIADLIARSWITVHLADDREIRMRLEAGMADGQVVRLKGQGIKLQNMKPGDVLVTLKIGRDAKFQTEGYDIHTALPISLEDAVLGTATKVMTPEGERDVVVPPWSGSDRPVRLSGLGLHNDAGGRGDLVVELRIVLLDTPDPKVTDLMRHMRHGLYI